MCDDVHRRLGPRPHPAISRVEIERRGLPQRFANQRQPLWRTPPKHVAPDPIAAKQPRPRLAHCIEPLESKLEAKRELLRTRVDVRVFGKQQAGFEICEPRRHYQIIGRNLQLQRPGGFDIVDILVG